jgi:hypothetical protein
VHLTFYINLFTRAYWRYQITEGWTLGTTLCRQKSLGIKITQAIYEPNCLLSLYLGIELKFMISVQEKYRLKKQKKYAPKVLIRRPVARRWAISLSYYFQILWKLHISFFYDVCLENKICTLVWENINILFVFGAFCSVHGNWYQVHDLYTLSCLIKINS